MNVGGANQTGPGAWLDGGVWYDGGVWSGGASPVWGCEGVTHRGACWYLGELGQSCDEVCEEHGGYSERTASSVGTEAQGGSVETCATVLDVLGWPGEVESGSRSDGQGLGCHVFGTDLALWWLRSPDLDAAALHEKAMRACICEQ